MTSKFSLLLLSALTPVTAFADTSLYGRINISAQAVETASIHHNKMVSNSSRIGLKGEHNLDSKRSVIYQLEYGIDIFDVDKESPIFTQRDIYLGLEGIRGSLLVGKLSTPLKSIKKIDLFNDLEGDIKSLITNNDNRKSNTLMYRSPLIADYLTFSCAYIAAKSGSHTDAWSLAMVYQAENHYFAVAYDQDVEKPNVQVLRLVSQYKLKELQLGALLEYQDGSNISMANGYAWLLSVKYLFNKTVLKGQFGHSETHQNLAFKSAETGKTYSAGMDYIFSEKTKLFGYYTVETSEQNSFDNRYLGIGVEFRF